MTRRILLAATAAAMTVMAMMAMASGCATRTEPSRPAPAAATGTRSGSTAAASASASVSTLSVDDQVREAVFRHLFAHNGSGSRDRAAVYFLSLGDVDKPQDPSPALMARFAQHRPRVEAISRARVGFEEGVRHRDTGERGLVFGVNTIKRVSDDVVEVEGGYYEGNLSASGNFYRVERKAGVWVVTDDKMQWVS
jgi:hypothetical protein